MLGYGYSARGKSDHEEFLEREVESLREDINRYEDESRERFEARRREIRERIEADRRCADSWPEALRKQKALYMEEAGHWEDDPDFPDTYFGPGAEACEYALLCWYEVSAERKAEIDELERKIEVIQEEIREAVAIRLEARNNGVGWQAVADALREEDMNEWLQW